MEITEEEHYQAALEAICRPRVSKGVNRFETAYLMLEDKNPRDKNAVRVEMRGKPVGYLSPEAAIIYWQQLKAMGAPRANARQSLGVGG